MSHSLSIIHDGAALHIFEIVKNSINDIPIVATISAINMASLDLERDIDYIDATVSKSKYIILVLGGLTDSLSHIIDIIIPIISHSRRNVEKTVVCISVGSSVLVGKERTFDAFVSLASPLPTDTEFALVEKVLRENLVVRSANRPNIAGGGAQNFVIQREAFTVAHFGLTIVDSIIEAATYFAEEPTRSLMSISTKEGFPWDETVLQALNSGLIDVAIYNQNEFENSRELYPHVHALRGMGSSMGGLNFFVLSQDASLARVAPSDWLPRMAGKKVILPMRSDISNSFQILIGCSLLDIEDLGAEVEDVSQFRDIEDILNAEPFVLLGGQNLRFSRRVQAMGYKEVANLASFPRALRQDVRKTARNALFMSDDRYRMIGAEAAYSLADDIWRAFRYAIGDEERRNILLDRLLEGQTQSSYRPILELIIRRGYGV